MSGSTPADASIQQVPGSQRRMPGPALLLSRLCVVGTRTVNSLLPYARRRLRLHFMSPVPDQATLWHYRYPTFLPAKTWKRHSAYLLCRKTGVRP